VKNVVKIIFKQTITLFQKKIVYLRSKILKGFLVKFIMIFAL